MKNMVKFIGVIVLVIMPMLTACGRRYCPEDHFEAVPVGGGAGVSITEYTGGNWEVRIPPRIHRIPVTGIGEEAFHRSNLLHLQLFSQM